MSMNTFYYRKTLSTGIRPQFNATAAGILSLILASGFASTTAEAQERCAGMGELQSISLQEWESGLGTWTVGQRQVADQGSFDTPDWSVIGGLPDGQGGQAAFVENVNTGNCSADDETGVLMLDSPPIALPDSITVPRISVTHWYMTEDRWDGGNLKLSVNGGAFTLIPPEAIELGEYDAELNPAFDEFGLLYNTNPLAGESAFTGVSGPGENGAWIQSWISLSGLAAPGDNIVLRLDFGIDCSDGVVGWYVDDLEVYACTGESPLPGCGNRSLDPGEGCDDGNGVSGDGCSDVCQVEAGWSCTDPVSAVISDPGFEGGTPNPSWNEVSNNPIGTPICEVAVCGLGGGTGPSEGDYWAWFGGMSSYQEGSLSQSLVIPQGVTELTFDLEVPVCDSAADYLEVTLDGQRLFQVNGASDVCGVSYYTSQSVDIGAFADGLGHQLAFHSESFANNGSYSNFFVDSLASAPFPSQCTQSAQTRLTLFKQVVNDNGGTMSAADWTLSASGTTSFSGPGPTVDSPTGFIAGRYELSETGPGGYSGGDWTCEGGNQANNSSILVGEGHNVTCTIRNDDIPPVLTLANSVVNDDGGTATAADWTLQASGPTPLTGPGPNIVSGDTFHAGTYDLSVNNGPDGYIATGWSCEGGQQVDSDTVRLSTGESVSCTITLDDYPLDSTINAGHAGGWFNLDTAGQGVLIDIEPENQLVFLAWYTFTEEDSEHPYEQRWLTAQGEYNGNRADLVLHETLGGQFDASQEVNTEPVGTVSLVFTGCSELAMSYAIDTEGLNGEMNLGRLIPGSEVDCAALASSQQIQSVDINAGMDGGWFELDTAGQGFLIDAHPDSQNGNFIFVSWFTYGDTNASGQRWLTAQGAFEGSVAEIALYETTGGIFENPLIPETAAIGTVSLDFVDCNNANLSYSIPEEQLAGDIALNRLLPDGDKRCEQLDNPQ